ncbi:MAG: hypothetical protein [Olavius algarvensis Gamma 1 endosymbiont]|nr:MAG: hypothetical protein [Olavius algarvensis Gamma 1 endosymbiont]
MVRGHNIVCSKQENRGPWPRCQVPSDCRQILACLGYRFSRLGGEEEDDPAPSAEYADYKP